MSGALAQARLSLTGHLLSHVAADGAVRNRCASRVLESALAYALLDATRLYPGARTSIARFLRARYTRSDIFDRLLIDTVLQPGERSEGREATDWLDSFNHFSAPRKRLLFSTVLAMLGTNDPAASPGIQIDPGRIEYRGWAPWVDLIQCAIRLFHLTRHGRAGEEERTFICERLDSPARLPAFEGNVLAHLLALTALQCHAPGHPLVADGLARLLTCRNDDGGLPFITGFEIFCTATTGLALLPAIKHPRRLPPGHARRAKTTLAAIGDYLAGQQRPDGGWAYAQDVQHSDVDDTAYCLQLLQAIQRREMPYRYSMQVAAAHQYLRDIANPDGGFPTFRRGHPSEIAMTAGAVSALAPRWAEHPCTAQAAVDYLLESQQPDGTFERSWSLSESNAIFRALRALRGAWPYQIPPASDRISRLASSATRRLLTTQHPDGGWGQQPTEPSDPISTAYALLALRPGQRARDKALSYLLTQQQPDGGYISSPDQAAPRPMPYDVPVLADINALWALSQG